MSKVLKAIKTTIFYVWSGQWIVDIVRRLIKTAGTIAESAFLLATIYVTINNVAHLLIKWTIPDKVIGVLNQIAVICFSVLPELIVVSAILVAYDHWCMWKETKERTMLSWAIAYTIPTTCFTVMTIITLSTFVNVESTQDISPTATGWMLVIRCLAGWFYALLQMMWTGRGKVGYSGHLKKLKGEIDQLRSENRSLSKRLQRPKGDQAKQKGDQVKQNGHLPSLVDII